MALVSFCFVPTDLTDTVGEDCVAVNDTQKSFKADAAAILH